MIKAFGSNATIVAGGFSGQIQPNGTAVSIALPRVQHCTIMPGTLAWQRHCDDACQACSGSAAPHPPRVPL